jgi:hypothetical protein
MNDKTQLELEAIIASGLDPLLVAEAQAELDKRKAALPPPGPVNPPEMIQDGPLTVITSIVTGAKKSIDKINGNVLSVTKAFAIESRDVTDPLKLSRGILLTYPGFATLSSVDGGTNYIVKDENEAKRFLGSRYNLEPLSGSEEMNAKTREIEAIIRMKELLTELQGNLLPAEALPASSDAELKAYLLTPSVAAPPLS